MNLKNRIPWWAKIIAKLILTRLPLSYSFWKRFGLFQLGHMEQADYAYGVFRRHFDRVDFTRKFDGFVALELGPGDLLSSAPLAYAYGASASYLIDTGCYAKYRFGSVPNDDRLSGKAGICHAGFVGN